MPANIMRIRKRNGAEEPFDPRKIERAISKALLAVGKSSTDASQISASVVASLDERFSGRIPGVEDIQDVVEDALMRAGYPDVAKAYILYRKQRAEVRRLKKEIGVEDDLKLSVNAVKVLERRYLLRDERGNVIETPSQLFRRVAHAVASVETNFNSGANVKGLEEAFFSMMSSLEFLSNTPTLMNAGAPLGQLSACFVIPVEDSVKDIFEALKNMALIHQSGGGTGFSFSHLRPKGDIVRSTKGVASGPISFMRCSTLQQAS